VLCFVQISAQKSDSKISIIFDNLSIEEALSEIEKNTAYHFYYAESWLDSTLIKGTYDAVSIENILEDIFENTLINFYILDQTTVILTKNSIIYDKLPEGFFGKPKDTLRDSESTEALTTAVPTFFGRTNKSDRRKIKVYRIGKEDKNGARKNYRLEGTVTDRKSGEPLSNLSIIVKGKNTGAVTNEEGYYSIVLPSGNNILETRSLGIESILMQVILFNDGQLNFELEEDVERLDEVVLQADADKNVKKAITGATEIDVEKSKNIPLVLGERDVLKVATSLPGISTAGEGASGFNVRGGKTDQNLFLFDNAVIYSPQHFFGIFSALNSFTLGQVEIYTGSIPAEYGGRLSSVFDLRTKKATTDKLSGEGSIGPVTGNLALEIPVVKEKSSLMIAGRGAYANWILRSLDEESLNRSEASFYDFTTTYEHQINENNQIKGTAYTSRDDFSITSDSLFIYENRLFTLNWNHRINNKNNLNLTIANSQYAFDIQFKGNSSDNFKLGYKINETGLKLKLRKLISTRFVLDYGIASKLYTIEPGSLRPIGDESLVSPVEIAKQRGLESAVFISGDIDITKKLSVDAGIRFSIFNALGPSIQNTYQEGQPKSAETVIATTEYGTNEVIETYGGPEFRISARYLLAEDFSIKASFNNSYQFIHRLTNNTTASPIDTWILSDLNIKPQQSNQYAIGLFKNLKGNIYEVSLEGYYKTSDNILDFKTGSQILLNANIEREVLQGQGKAYGLEFLIRKNLGKLNGWLGYTYSRSFTKFDSEFNEERVNDGMFFPSNFDKPHDISIVANYKFTKRFSLSTNFVYQTGRPVTFPVGNFTFNGSQFVAFSDRNQFRIPDYYRLDIGFNVEGNHKKNKLAHSFWTFSIYNVLGRNNPYSVFFVSEQGKIKALQTSIFTIPVPSITYNFKF
jgi:hypothetical protein